MRRTSAAVLTAVAAVALAACGVSPDARPTLLGAGDVPRGALPAASTPSSGSARALVYLVRNGMLVAVARAVPPHPTPEAVLQLLISGPSRGEQDAGFLTAVTAATVEGEPRAGVVTVEVPAPDVGSSGRTDEVLGFGQIVLSLASLPGITSVRFTRDGRPLAVPRSDGSLSPVPRTRQDYTDLL